MTDRLEKLKRLALAASNHRIRMTLWSAGLATTSSGRAAVEALEFDNALKELNLGPSDFQAYDKYYLALGQDAICPVCKNKFNAPLHLFKDVWMHTSCHETLD